MRLSTSCDFPDPVVALPPGLFLHVSSDSTSDRFRTETILAEAGDGEGEGRNRLMVDDAARFQQILGWGGAFTDSATMVIDSLDQGAQDQLLRWIRDRN